MSRKGAGGKSPEARSPCEETTIETSAGSFMRPAEAPQTSTLCRRHVETSVGYFVRAAGFLVHGGRSVSPGFSFAREPPAASASRAPVWIAARRSPPTAMESPDAAASAFW